MPTDGEPTGRQTAIQHLEWGGGGGDSPRPHSCEFRKVTDALGHPFKPAEPRSTTSIAHSVAPHADSTTGGGGKATHAP